MSTNEKSLEFLGFAAKDDSPDLLEKLLSFRSSDFLNVALISCLLETHVSMQSEKRDDIIAKKCDDMIMRAMHSILEKEKKNEFKKRI